MAWEVQCHRVEASQYFIEIVMVPAQPCRASTQGLAVP